MSAFVPPCWLTTSVAKMTIDIVSRQWRAMWHGPNDCRMGRLVLNEYLYSLRKNTVPTRKKEKKKKQTNLMYGMYYNCLYCCQAWISLSDILWLPANIHLSQSVLVNVPSTNLALCPALSVCILCVFVLYCIVVGLLWAWWGEPDAIEV